MFDRTVLAFGGPTHEHHHTHIEMVDPSIEKGARFLDEVQAKAQQRITEAVLVGVPGIEITAARYDYCMEQMTGTGRHRLAFRINGKPYDVPVSTAERDDPQTIVRKLAEAVAAEIVRQAVIPSITKTLHIGFRNPSPQTEI